MANKTKKTGAMRVLNGRIGLKRNGMEICMFMMPNCKKPKIGVTFEDDDDIYIIGTFASDMDALWLFDVMYDTFLKDITDLEVARIFKNKEVGA